MLDCWQYRAYPAQKGKAMRKLLGTRALFVMMHGSNVRTLRSTKHTHKRESRAWKYGSHRSPRMIKQRSPEKPLPLCRGLCIRASTEQPSGTERSRTRTSAESAGESMASKRCQTTVETIQLHIDDDG